MCDHLQGIPDPATPVLEGWTTLAAISGAVNTIGLGTLVLAATFRPPRVLAASVATLAEIAPGRLTIGLGAGWHEPEHRAFGIPFPPFTERIARLDQSVDAIREAAPSVPILVGGASQPVLDLAARKADIWNAPADRLDDLQELVRDFRRLRESTGREVEIVARVGVLLAETAAEVEERLARRTSPWTRVGLGPLGFVGDADEILSRISQHSDLGIRRFILGFSPRDLKGDALERFADQVVSRVP